MSAEPREKWLDYLALTTVILAVCATLSTFKGGGFSTRSIMSQSQASDQWAYYQAKGVKSSLYELQKEKLEFELANLPATAPESVTGHYHQLIDASDQRIRRYGQERQDIEAKAKALEQLRDDAQRHSQAFGIAVIFFQVAILVSSIAGLFKRKGIWLCALPVGLVGVLYFVDGFLPFL